jgi:hypothetical protein
MIVYSQGRAAIWIRWSTCDQMLGSEPTLLRRTEAGRPLRKLARGGTQDSAWRTYVVARSAAADESHRDPANVDRGTIYLIVATIVGAIIICCGGLAVWLLTFLTSGK